MPNSRFGRGLSLRWVVVSYRTIAGALLLAFFFRRAFELESLASVFALYGGASLFGGVISGQTSARPRHHLHLLLRSRILCVIPA